MTELDIVIPVYREGRNILPVLASLEREVRTPFRVLICYDHDDDDTLTAIGERGSTALEVRLVKNTGHGAHGAVLTGFRESEAPYVVILPADDDYNTAILDEMVHKAKSGADIVCASRFMDGGCMLGCRWLKSFLVRAASFTLYHVARLPVHDATNGFRMFSARLLNHVEIESTTGFCYSLELLVKCHRLRWKIAEVPAHWYERKQGQSRFRILRWLPHYLRWYGYAFSTTYLLSNPSSVKLQTNDF